jgi:hypothetical protein
MTAERKVNAAPLCRRELGLFCNKHEAWAHLVKHVLGAREACGWAVLIPALRAPLSAGRRAELQALAREGSPERVPNELAPIWGAFLELIAAAVEQAARLGWFWEENPVSEEGPYRAFAASGILAYLDYDFVRTGFLPWGELPAGGCERDRRYQLFYRCWQKVRRKYYQTKEGPRGVQAPPTFEALMRKVPAPAEWEQLK